MNYYTPVKLAPIYATVYGVLPGQGDIAEMAPVCRLTREKAISYARSAYGNDAGIMDDDTLLVESV